MSTAYADEGTDPLEQEPAAERLNYAIGQMLDAGDLRDEQTYHRGRLARLAKYLLGHGTLAGLRVTGPDADDAELHLTVEPGVAIDRYGRLVEIASPQCIRLARWFDDRGDAELNAASHSEPRVPKGDMVAADLFLSAHSCGAGKTPAFATGPFDALDAVVSSRLAERGSLALVLRAEGGPDPIPEPANAWPAGANAEKRLQAVLGSWDEGTEHRTADGPNPFAEHVAGLDPSAIFLARIFLPIKPPSAPETRPRLQMSKRVTVDNSKRPFIFFPGKWFGREIDEQPLVQP